MTYSKYLKQTFFGPHAARQHSPSVCLKWANIPKTSFTSYFSSFEALGRGQRDPRRDMCFRPLGTNSQNFLKSNS